ncbi:MAG: radical SAM protein [Candidatus Omnitrophica bacterium]|nr:radical SAM protein [Candidatus Omnitrophota bacterium]MDE2008575.1 radical SAM protein [Candidatus Omnitrophota bacterium]MDE2214041.1 radical SAM protein [Candidatus Omnitrophota bacterium]
MKKGRSLAILQIIPKHHELLPVGLMKALSLLDALGHPYGFYDIERSPDPDFRSSLMHVLSGIKEDTVLVSMACHNNYPKIESLIFLYLYLPLLKDKKIIICSPYFSLYETSLIQRDNIVFSPLNIDEYILRHIGNPRLTEDAFFEGLGASLKRYGYEHYRFWEYLTFGCWANCSFCYNRLPFEGSPAITRHSPDRVLRWMRFAEKSGKTYFEFCEPNFISDRPFTEDFLARLQRENPGVTWRCKTRLDDIDPDIYGRMTAAGCRTIFFGVEHVDLSLLRRIRKGENSPKRLAEFLKYRRKETEIHLSFMMGIRGETPSALRRNLEVVLRVGAIEGVEPNIGWQILFNRRHRSPAAANYIVPFMFIMNFLPSQMEISPALMRDILQVCLREPFFDFWYMTEAEDSLALMQQLVTFLKSRPQQKVIRDYDRLLRYQGGDLTKLILKSRTLEQLNSSVLSMAGV